MKNMYGETVKPQYEVALMTYDLTHQTIEQAKENNDLWTFSFMNADNYRAAVKIAKKMSNLIGTEYRGDYGVGEIVDVRIVCYFADDTSEYNEVWFEYYNHGKKEFRVNAD